MAVGDGFNDGLMMQYANISVEIVHPGYRKIEIKETNDTKKDQNESTDQNKKETYEKQFIILGNTGDI